MAFLFDAGIFSVEGLSGEILPGTKLYWYESGTSTPLATYSNEALTTPNANPVLSDSEGRFPSIWLQDANYKLVMELPNGTQRTRDPIRNPGSGVFVSYTDLASTDPQNPGASKIGLNPGWLGAVGRTAADALKDTLDAAQAGVIPDSSADQTDKIQAVLNYSVIAKRRVSIGAGAYSVTQLVIPAGSPGLDASSAVIKGRGGSTTGVIVLGSTIDPLIGAFISVNVDVTAGDPIAIQGYSTSDCIITGCRASGFVNNATLNHFGLRLNGACKRNVIANNNFKLRINPTQRGFGIAIYGVSNASVAFGGFFAGAPVRADDPAVANAIIGNSVTDGSYAISLQACEFCVVSGNVGTNLNHRGMFTGDSSWYNTIIGNSFYGFTTGILLSYGSCYNNVEGNYFYTTVLGGEAGVAVQTGSTFNTVRGNKIVSSANYGVYVGPDCVGTEVLSNSIEDSYVAHICVENDWLPTRPTNNQFSRPNYEAPPAGENWSHVTLADVVIKGNIFGAGAATRSIASVFVAQIDGPGATSLTGVRIVENEQVSSTNVGTNLAIYRMTDAKATGWIVKRNNWHASTPFSSATPLTASADWEPVSAASDNGALDTLVIGGQISIADGTVIPSVIHNGPPLMQRVFALNNTTATSVTNFSGGVNGQRITVRLSINTTIVHDNTKIRLKGGADISGVSSNNFVDFLLIGSVWYEIGGRNW